MSRYEITDDGKTLLVKPPSAMASCLTSNEMVAGAIRQQQSDLAALKELLAGEVEANEAFRKAGGALDGEDMPTFCARIIAEAEIGREWLKDSSLAKWFPLTAERVDEDAQEIAKLRARLDAIDAAPIVAFIGIDRKGIARATYFPEPHPSHAMMDLDAKFRKWTTQELIARQAKDGGT